MNATWLKMIELSSPTRRHNKLEKLGLGTWNEAGRNISKKDYKRRKRTFLKTSRTGNGWKMLMTFVQTIVDIVRLRLIGRTSPVLGTYRLGIWPQRILRRCF